MGGTVGDGWVVVGVAERVDGALVGEGDGRAVGSVGCGVGVDVGVLDGVIVGVGVGGESEMVNSSAYIHPEPKVSSTWTHSPWRAMTLTLVPQSGRVISGDSMSGDCRTMASRTLTRP